MDVNEKLVSGNELSKRKNQRKKEYIYENIEPELLDKKVSEGWSLFKELKKTLKVQKKKPFDERFEDEVWILLASLGFKIMNKDRTFKFPYDSKNPCLSKQIDVFAADEETVLFVECKSSEKGRKASFKETIEAIKGIQGGLFSEAKKLFPGRKMKFILATKNYEINDSDQVRIKDANIQLINEKSIKYYFELVKHFGMAARFQFLGQIFSGKKIKAMENKIPAIQGKMGGLTYYSFSIEPEKLLKISYVLHRTDANVDMMPTYQRLVKRERLRCIKKFINGGGFFPNSIIISIDTDGKRLKFDYATLKGDTDISKIGILHLPQIYRSAYVIDGQHRLYGYSETSYAESNTIPVVAFENLAQSKQVELFMQINENQKSVPKNLRHTLNSDLLWDDKDWNKRRNALRLRLAQSLGERPGSPLYEKVIIGENEKTPFCCITMDTFDGALKATKFLSKYSNEKVLTENGIFDKGDIDATFDYLYRYLELCFSEFENRLPDEWGKGEADNGILTINVTVYALIRLFYNIADFLIATEKCSSLSDSPDLFFDKGSYYLEPLISYLCSVNKKDRNEIKGSYGSGGKIKVWRLFQNIIAENRDDFKCYNPDDLEKYMEENTKKYNEESYKIIRAIEQHMSRDFRGKLRSRYGDNWFIEGLPKKVYDAAKKLAADKDYENKLQEGKTDPWDCITIINYREIAIHGRNWTELFESTYTLPTMKKGNKQEKTKWMEKLNRIRNTNFHTYSVKIEEFEFLKELESWIIVKEV